MRFQCKCTSLGAIAQILDSIVLGDVYVPASKMNTKKTVAKLGSPRMVAEALGLVVLDRARKRSRRQS